MNILIKETELRSLSFIDWHDGQEYTEQLISASGEDPNFLFDQDGEVFMTDAPTFISGTPSSEAITISNLYAQHLACSRFPKLNTIRSYTSNFFVF